LRAELTNARNILSNLPNEQKVKFDESLLIDCIEPNKESLLQINIDALTEENEKQLVEVQRLNT
jgi:hypothetical protein